jgi:putative addiction module component (TIGR02574 family)
MSRDIAKIDKEASDLPRHDRALLIERLLATLDQGEEIDAEEMWLDEAERRYQEYRAGRIGAKPAEQVFEEARKRMK